MLLAVAERCVAAPFDHTLVLAALDAEEQGLQGAQARSSPRPPVPRDRIALERQVSTWSAAATGGQTATSPGPRPAAPPSRPLLKGPASRATITVKFGHDTGGGQDDWTQQSDHGPFHTAGIPFVYLGVEDRADYHKPSDTADKIDPRFLGGVAAFVLNVVGGLDGAAAYGSRPRMPQAAVRTAGASLLALEPELDRLYDQFNLTHSTRDPIWTVRRFARGTTGDRRVLASALAFGRVQSVLQPWTRCSG